jgi:hypothetical protein
VVELSTENAASRGLVKVARPLARHLAGAEHQETRRGTKPLTIVAPRRECKALRPNSEAQSGVEQAEVHSEEQNSALE